MLFTFHLQNAKSCMQLFFICYTNLTNRLLIGGVMDNKNNDNYKKHNKGKFDLPFMVFLIICIPILVINLIIIIRGNMNPDRVPDVFGYKPFAVVSGSMETSINVGDLVIVPAGRDNHEAVVEVEEIEYFSEDEVPLPVEKTKRIIRKYLDDDFD